MKLARVVLTLAWISWPFGSSGLRAQDPSKAQPVYVVNQPQTLTVQGEVRLAAPIEGEVSIRGPIPQGKAVVLGEVEVPPVQKTDVTRWVAAGTVNTEGFAAMVVSLAGMQRSAPTKAGEVGVVLLPVEDLPIRAFHEQGELLFAVESHVLSSPGSPPYFGSQPLRATVAFPRYRVLLYNGSDRTVTATVYVYLTN